MARKVTTLIKNMKKNGYTEPDVADDWEDRFEYDYKGSTIDESNARMEQLKENASASYAAYKARKAQTEADKATGLYQYNNATDDQKSALENIYTAQTKTLTGFDRYAGNNSTSSASALANQFKTDYGVSDDDYNILMNGYKTYRNSQSANALATYDNISDEQKKALEKIRSLKTDGTANNTTVSGGDRYSGYKTSERNAAGTLAQKVWNNITGKTQQNNAEASALKEEFKEKYGVDDTTYSTWQARYDKEQTDKEEDAAAHKEGVRTQSQELEYANKSFSNVTSKDTGDGTSWNDRTNALKQAMYDYIDQEDATQTSEGMQYAESASNISSELQKQKSQLAKTKAAIQSKYNLSDDEFDDLKYYGQELYDAENRKKQQQEAYSNVHTGSRLKNVAGALKNTATALTLNAYGGIGAIGETLKYNAGAYRDGQSPINVNSTAFGATNATTDYQSATQQVISDKNKALGVLYGAGMSAVESAETGALGGATSNRALASALSLAPFAANAYGNALSENISNDQRQSKAFENALTSAAIETVTEIASADKFWDIFKNHNATARKKIVDFLVSSGIEGSEEVLGDIADNFMDAVVNGQNSEYNQSVRSYMMSGMSEEEAKEQATKDSVTSTVESFVSGALSGAMGAGIATAAGYANDVTTANNLFDNYTKEDYAEWADSLETDPSNYKNASAAQSAQKAKELATKMSQEETPTSKKEKTQLYEYYQDIVDIEDETAAKNRDEANQQRVIDKIAEKIDSGIDRVASAFGREGNAESASAQQTATENQTTEQATDSAQESISDASNIPEEYRSKKNNTSYNDAYKAIQSSTTQDELNEAMQTAKNSEEISWEDYEKLEQTAGSYAASKNNLDLEQAKISTEDAYTAGYSGQEIGNVPPALQIAYNDGVQQAANDRAEQKAMNEEAVQKAAAKQNNDGLRSIIESNYQDGMNASTYSEVMASAINAGRTGMAFEDYAQENGASLSIVGEDIAKTAFKAGQQAAIDDAVKEAARSMAEKAGVKAFGTGTFTDSRSNTTESIHGAGVMKAVARMTGLNIVLKDNGFNDRENGYYQAADSTIYINAGQADRMASTLFHEVGEFASVWNQEEYASVVNDIMQASQKALGSREFNRLRQKYANAYHGETGKTDADIDKEMANDLLYQFLGNEKGMNKLMDEIDRNHGYKDAKSIKQRLADWVGRMVDSIKNFLSQLQPNSYQRRMAEASLQNYEALQDSIAKSIANAEKNYSDARAAAAETKAIEQGKGSIEDYGVENESTGEKRLSIETYEHGGREYLENFLENTDDLTDEQKDDILDHMEWAYNLAKDLAKSNQYEFFGQWSQTGLAKRTDGVPLIEVRTASDSKPIRSVAVNNGEYPLNIDFSQVCKKRSTLNAVLNYMVKNYGMNLRTLTASDVININQAIKKHGFEIACGLCFVDAKRYRTGAWASTFTEGTRNKKGELNANQPGYNNLVRMIRPKDGSDVGYSYFNFATSIPTESARTIDQLSDDELDLSRLKRKLGRYAKYDENGNLIGIGGYKDDAGRTKNPTETIRLAWAIYSNPEMRHLISEEDLISSDGLDAMRDQNSTLYSLVNAHWGAGKPKLSHGGTAYGNEILRSTEWGSKNDFNPESAAKVGGVRVQSFSDYEANMFFDYMQLFADMSARQLTSHGYTKEPYYAKLFGMTGQKINLSVVAKAAELTAEQQARYEKLVNKGGKYLLEDPEFKEIAEHAGLGKDENGNWTRLLVEDETFPLQEALDLQKDPRYNSNCGIIWIGVSDAQIRVLLDSDDVPMVIPYHSSGVSRIVKKARNLLLYTDYTNKQNTRTKDGKKITGKDFDFYGSLARTNDVITTTNEYLAWCKDHNYLPKFDQFADHPNYYKLLIDFRAYDYNGIDPEKMASRVYQPQRKITMTFPENFNELVAASLAEQQATKDLEAKEFTDAQGSLLSDVKDVLGLDGSSETGKRNSLDIDSDDNTLTESQQKYFENSKVRDEDGRLKVMYHGTQTGGFTVFDVGKSKGSNLYGRGIYFSDSKSMAGDYGNTYEVYLNVTNPIQSGNKTITKDQLHKLVNEIAENEDYGIENYGYGATVDSVVKSVWGKDDFQMLQDLNATCVGDFVETVKMFNELNGTDYDGIIDDTQTVVWNANQIKSVDNQNPTQAADIRRAVGIDETWDDFDWSAEGEQIQSGLADALKSGNEILKGATVNEANIRRIARQLKDQYSSRISVDELADTLTKVFAYAQNQDYINYNDLATVISEVASPMIEQSTVKVGAQEFKDFKQTLQGYTFNLDEKQQKEVISAFGSWGAFRKALPGIKFTRDGAGVSLDGVWDSLCEESGNVLSRDVTSNDMPLELVDAYNAMKPTYENAFGEDAMNASQDAAMEIVSKYYQYEAQRERNDLRKKQKEDLENLSKKIAQTNAEMRKNLQRKYNERLEKEIAKVKKENKPEKVSVQVARLRARNAKTVASLREAQKRKDQLRTLNRNATRLVDWVTDPTDKNHIPALLQTPVLELVAAMDFVPQTVRETADGKYSIRLLESRHVNEDGSYSYTWKTITADTVQEAVAAYKKAMNDFGLGSASNKKWQERMQTIQDLYQQSEEDDWFEKSELKQGLDKNLGEQLGDILKNNRGMLSISELSSDELQTINDVVRNVMHSVNQMNRMYSQPSQKVTDVAHEVMDRAYEQKAKGRQAHGKMGNIFLDTFTLDHATPETFFHGLFGGNETDPITKTMIKAQNQKARDIRQAQEYMEEYMTDDVKKVVKDWMYSKTGDHNTRNFYGMDLTTTQVMSLYELMKRPDAQQHKVGGFMVDETGRKTDGRHKVVHLTDEQITNITDTLSEEQKRIADAMQYYMAHQCAEQGNETAMQLYGYEKYLDEHYFPMATDKNTIATKDSNVTTGAVNAIKNSGFTKKITPNATNPLILKDIFTVFSDHVSDMATYHSWAAPLQDILRFYNYNEKTNVDNDGQTFIERRSTKDAFDYFYGENGQQYMTRLLSSINQMEKSNFVGGKFMEMMTGNAKAAAVMGNIRVVVQQPTAFFRAGEMISYKHLNDGLTGKYAKEAAELRDRTSDVFWLKNQGNIDGYITQGMVSTITGVQTTKEKINEKAGFLAGKADEITWAAMYRAVYAEQVDKLGKSKVGTEEFENAVNDRFSEIMLRTQVYDGTITRSQFMRSTDKYNTLASAFMAEPVKTYNIVLRHMIDLMQADSKTQLNAAKKGLAKAAGVLTLTNAANAVVQSLWDAFRNAGDADDEDKDFLQRFLDALGLGFLMDEDANAVSSIMGGNFVDNMDLLSNIPLVADYWDAVKSGFKSLSGGSTYSSDSDLSMSAINNFFKAAKAIVNPGEKMTTYGRFAAVARGFSDMTGIPLYAVQRDAVAIYNVLAKDIANGLAGANLPVLQKTSKYTKAQQAKQDVYEGVITDVYENAVNSGDYKEAIENAVEQGSSYKSIKQSLKSNTQDIYVRLLKTDPSEATKMKNRLAQMYTYLDEKTDVRKDKTEAEKLEYHKGEIDKWKADWEEKQAEEQK